MSEKGTSQNYPMMGTGVQPINAGLMSNTGNIENLSSVSGGGNSAMHELQNDSISSISFENENGSSNMDYSMASFAS